jgi:hypothetical protein
MQSACAVLYCHLWPVWLYHIFPHYLINGTIFGKKLSNIKCVFLFSLQLLSETFLILRRIQPNIIINVHSCSCKVPVALVRFWWNFNFQDRFSTNSQISNFMKIRPVGAELFHADGRTDSQTNMTKLTVTFRNFASSPNKPWHIRQTRALLYSAADVLTVSRPAVHTHYLTFRYISQHMLHPEVCSTSLTRL